MANYNEVVVTNNNIDKSNFKEINPEYVYLTIPAEYVCVYHKLLSYMADFGKVIVDDCNAACKGNGKNIINCWNLFQSAIACKAIGQDKQAEFFINYITKQLDNIYKGSDDKVYNCTQPIAITPDGKLEAIVTCGNDVHFYVNLETGKLYEEHLASKEDCKVYAVEDGELTVTDSRNTVNVPSTGD